MPCNAPVEFFIGQYLSDYSFDLVIDHKDLSEDYVYGWCYKEGDKEFLIEIHDDLDEERYLLTVFHEMTHVFQHLANKPLFEGEADYVAMWMLDKYKESQ